jgi:hypothetical protein
MENRGKLSKILAIAGTVLVWLPILAPVLVTVASLLQQQVFSFDYLMPAELFLLALVGGGTLILVARRARLGWRLIGWSLGIAAIMLGAGQVLALATGLASGEAQAAGWPLALVRDSLYAYILALVFAGLGGILLTIRVFNPVESQRRAKTPKKSE